MPFKLSQASMVTSPTGRGVVIIGGWNENSKKYSTSLFELDGRSMEWVKLKQKLGSYSSHLVTNPEFLLVCNCFSKKNVFSIKNHSIFYDLVQLIRTTNTNPEFYNEFFVYSLFEYFYKVKSLN